MAESEKRGGAPGPSPAQGGPARTSPPASGAPVEGSPTPAPDAGRYEPTVGAGGAGFCVAVAVMIGLSTLWTLFSTFFLRFLAAYGGVDAVASFSRASQIAVVLFSLPVACALLFCAKRSGKWNRVAFLIGAVGYFLPAVRLLLAQLSDDNVYQSVLGTVLGPAGALLAAGMLGMLALHRRGLPSVRLSAAAACLLSAADAAASFLVCFSGLRILLAENTAESISLWLRMLSFAGNAQFFLALACGVLTAMCFALISTAGVTPAADRTKPS